MYRLRTYLKLTSECEPRILPNTEVSAVKNHGENYIKVRLLLAGHPLHNRLFHPHLDNKLEAEVALDQLESGILM